MARPTSAKLNKMKADLEKIREKLMSMGLDLNSMASNPKGSDMELARQLKEVRADLEPAGAHLRDAGNRLDGPIAILIRRKK